MILIDPCPDAIISLDQSPIISKEYVLRDQPISQPWQASQLFTVDVLVDCGPITVEFFYDNIDRTPLNTTIFDDVRDTATQNEFIVKYNEEPTLKGSYAIKYKIYYTNYPANFVELQNAIILTIIDPCDEPVAVIPSTLIDQQYTIT